MDIELFSDLPPAVKCSSKYKKMKPAFQEYVSFCYIDEFASVENSYAM
jgi:hypothetical protein